LNPMGRSYGHARAEIEAQTRAAGWPEPVFLTTTVAEPGASQTRRALDAGAQLVIVGGGDGTTRIVAGAMARSGVPLGIVPLGTANLFARNLGLHPRHVVENVATALHGVPRAVDVGRARHRLGGAWSEEKPFFVMAGIGYDAATVQSTRPELKRRLGWLAYFGSAIRHLLRRPVWMVLSTDGRPQRTVRTWCVLAANCGGLPGGVRVFDDARLDDGVLDTLEVPLTSPLSWLPIAAKGLLRLSGDVPALRYGRAHDLVVRPPHPMPLQLDGDVVPRVAEVRVHLEASALIVQTHSWTTISTRWNSLTSV
jgi:diacylglycerol kinase (ATP)